MIVDRRATLAGLMGGAVMGGTSVQAAITQVPGTLFIDSRRAATEGFRTAVGGAHVIDLARAHDSFWAEVRRFKPDGHRVRGMTRWSDWVLLRGALQDKGLRVSAEMPVDAAHTGDDALFLWEMT